MADIRISSPRTAPRRACVPLHPDVFPARARGPAPGVHAGWWAPASRPREPSRSGRYLRAMPGSAPDALHFTADPEANRLLAEGAARGPDRHAPRPAGDDGVGVRCAAAAEAPAGGRPPRSSPRSRPWIPPTLDAIFRDKPALHRYPGSMAKRTHDLCTLHRRHYDGRTEASGPAPPRARSCSPGCTRCPVSARTRRASSSGCSASGWACSRRVGAGRGRLGVDRRRRLLRAHRRDPREEARGQGRQEGRESKRGERPRSNRAQLDVLALLERQRLRRGAAVGAVRRELVDLRPAVALERHRAGRACPPG